MAQASPLPVVGGVPDLRHLRSYVRPTRGRRRRQRHRARENALVGSHTPGRDSTRAHVVVDALRVPAGHGSTLVSSERVT